MIQSYTKTRELPPTSFRCSNFSARQLLLLTRFRIIWFLALELKDFFPHKLLLVRAEEWIGQNVLTDSSVMYKWHHTKTLSLIITLLPGYAGLCWERRKLLFTGNKWLHWQQFLMDSTILVLIGYYAAETKLTPSPTYNENT